MLWLNSPSSLGEVVPESPQEETQVYEEAVDEGEDDALKRKIAVEATQAYAPASDGDSDEGQ